MTTRGGHTEKMQAMSMKEVIFYLIAAATSLIVLGYTVHMFVGGLVSTGTERLLIIGAALVAVIAIGFMARDVMKRRGVAKSKSD